MEQKTTDSVVLNLIEKLGNKVEGRKKIMKLMFLINHWDIENQKLVNKPFLNNEFIIYRFGVFSFDVMDSIINLIKEGKIEDSYPIKMKSSIKNIKLSDEIVNKIDKIVNMFGNENSRTLEINTLKMLNIKIDEKFKYLGQNVSEII